MFFSGCFSIPSPAHFGIALIELFNDLRDAVVKDANRLTSGSVLPLTGEEQSEGERLVYQAGASSPVEAANRK